jgi:predicted ATPase
MPFIRIARRVINQLAVRRSTSDEPLAAEFTILREQVLKIMLKECSADFEYVAECPRAITAASQFLSDFFKSGIRYLGPLRDSPRPMYQLETLESTTNVGYRGEHTAAVLDLNSAEEINYHSPPNELADSEYVTSSPVRRASLHDAVVEWLSYLGIADEVVTTEAGVFGNRLQVSTDGAGRLQDLTNVGVGVSQVLPIVVMALLAPPGSFLIFEQPELHLHPRVQARLADFFLALALDGKQTILETHSEYLVDRFRLRIALSSSDSVRPLINILFSEKSAGQSTLTPLEISEFGSIANWPKDFFDQSQRDVGRIVKAASEKRSKRRGA